MTTTAVGDPFDDAERGLEWLEKLEALQARSASDRAAYEVAEYVMQLRAAVTALAGRPHRLRSERGRGPGDGGNWSKSCARPATRTTGTRGSSPPC